MAELSPATEERVIRSRRGLVPVDFAELRRYRELFFFLAWRDIIIRYKQTAIGIGWAVLQPVVTMVVFTVIFGRVAKLPSHGTPYPIVVFSALLPWQLFQNSLQRGSNSVVLAAHMIRKVYFPRLIIPGSAVLGSAVDFLISLAILLLMMCWYWWHSQITFRIHLLLLPVFLLVAMAAAMGPSLWLSALSAKYRDVGHLTPFLIRVGMYASPVAYISDIVPDKYRLLYSLNPMVGVIEGFRWAIMGPTFEPYWPGFAGSLAVVAVCLVSGLYFFRFQERRFADVI